MVCEPEGYRCDANINERNVDARQVRNLGDTPQNKFMGAGKYDNKHRVGIMLNRKWRQKNIDTEYITIVVNHQRIELMSVYFLHSGDADHHVEKCTEQSRSTRQTTTIAYRLVEETSILSWDQDAELNVQVLANTHSLNQSNTRGDWMETLADVTIFLQHSTRCTERILGNKRPTDHQKEMRSKPTTSY